MRVCTPKVYLVRNVCKVAFENDVFAYKIMFTKLFGIFLGKVIRTFTIIG